MSDIREAFWTPEQWDRGYHDSNGRFRVYRPDYPGHYSNGCAMRSHVVFWLETGQCPPKDKLLHHINGIKDDDRIENLILLGHSEHTTIHCANKKVSFVCSSCGKQFYVRRCKVEYVVNSRGAPPKYCSRKCYYDAERTKEHGNRISMALKAHYAKEGKSA